MKKISFKVAALLLSSALLCSSCIGSFALFNGYEKWQCNMTDSKIINGIVGLILQPIVGGVCLFVDALVLNTLIDTSFITLLEQKNEGVKFLRELQIVCGRF